MLDKHSTTEPHPQAEMALFKLVHTPTVSATPRPFVVGVIFFFS